MIPSFALKIRSKIEDVIPDERVVPAHTETQHFYKDAFDGEVYASVTTKTSLLSREYYKQLAADKAVEHIQNFLLSHQEYEPEELTKVFEEARTEHARALSQAGSWGTEAHDIVDSYVKEWIRTGEMPLSMKDFVPSNTTPSGMCGALSAEVFFKEWTLFPVVSEKKVISKKHRYAGTLDSMFLVGHTVKESSGTCDTMSHNWEEKSRIRLKCTWCKKEVKLTPSILDWKTSNQIFGHGSMGKYEYAMQVGAYSEALKEMTGVTVKDHWIVRLDKSQPMYEIGLINDIKTATKMFLNMSKVNDFAHSSVPPIVPLNGKKTITL